MADFNIDPTQSKIEAPRYKKENNVLQGVNVVCQFFEFHEHIFTNETVAFWDAGDAFESICKTLVDDGKIGRFVEYEQCVHEFLLLFVKFN